MAKDDYIYIHMFHLSNLPGIYLFWGWAGEFCALRSQVSLATTVEEQGRSTACEFRGGSAASASVMLRGGSSGGAI
jgi:hypothetical protein